MSEIQPETAPGDPAIEADIAQLQADIAALEEQKAAGQPGGAIDAQIAEKQKQIDAANAPTAGAEAASLPTGVATGGNVMSTTAGAAAVTFTTPPVAPAAPDQVNVTVVVGDTTYTGTIPKQ